MASGAFTSVNRRRAKRGKEVENGGGKKGDEKLSQHHSIRSGFWKRPNVEWDYRSFSVIVAKADESAIGAGLEKMISERFLMASYNWDVDSWIPTIVVPGAPKVFNPWQGGTLETRNQVMTIDEESFRIPNAPMEPLFTAVRLCQPDFKLRDVDLVADLNCLKKLLRFVLRAAFSTPDVDETGSDDQTASQIDVDRNILAGANNGSDFRIDAQVIGRTVVLMRRESEHRGRAMGFGVGYLDACTKPYGADPSASGPHKRITYVKFGNLRMMLRHKVLAAIYPDTTKGNDKDNSASNGHDSGDRTPWPSSFDFSTVRHVRGGYLDDHNRLTQVEFASVSKERKSPLVIDKWLDMLFIGSDNIYLGEHVRGRFQEPVMRHRSEALELSGMKPSDGRRILVILEMLLDKIIQYGRRSGSGRNGGNEEVDGGGDGDGNGKRRPGPSEKDTFSFSLVSRDECRKLVVFKNGPSQGKPAIRDESGKRSNTLQCVSDAMMAALLADD